MTQKLVNTHLLPEPICILVCQNRTCRKQGATEVLATFRSINIPHITSEGCGCLGNCGNGPIVLILPAKIWYYHVRPQDILTIVTAIVDRHD
jgi:(2Fe-2S) ferredoxin